MKISNEAKVGLMISVVLGLLAILTLKTGNFNFSKSGFTIKVYFRNIDGVSTNAPVMINGLEVGHVEDITIVEGKSDANMELLIWLAGDAKIREGAEAYVKNMGFMGEKYVGLTSGQPDGAILKDGAIIIGKNPADIDKIMQDGQVIAANIKSITDNLDERLTKNSEAVDAIFADMRSTMKHLASVSKNVDERISLNAGKIDDIVANLKSATYNLDHFTYDLKRHPWKLLYRSREKREENLQKPNP